MSDAEEYPDLFPGARDYVLAKLPAKVVQLHKEIEEFADCTVDFRPTTMLDAYGIKSRHEDSFFCDETRAYVTVDDRTGVNAEAVTHELLHLHRYWVEQVPMLDAAVDIGENVEFMTWLDNALEHLIIVPREREYGFDPASHWARSLMAIFEPDPNQQNSLHLSRSYLIGWTMTAYCDDLTARRIALKRLQSLGMQRNARLLLEKLLKLRKSKEAMARVALEEMKLHPRNALLVTLDIRNRKRVETQLT